MVFLSQGQQPVSQMCDKTMVWLAMNPSVGIQEDLSDINPSRQYGSDDQP